MDKFGVSAANLMKLCPRKYYYSQVLGWEPKSKPPWLTKGSAYDDLLSVYDVEGDEKAYEAIPALFENEYEQVDAALLLSKYDTQFGHEKYRPKTFNGQKGNQLGFGVVWNGNEVTGPVAFKATGYLDKLSEREGELLVVERKTTSEAIEPNSDYWAKLPLDPQIRSYVWYLRSQGAQTGWVLYEVLRKCSTSVNQWVYDKKVPIEEYREKVFAQLGKNGKPLSATMVARKLIYISEEMSDEWITEHTFTHQHIEQCKERQERIEEAGYEGFYAWVKHEQSCKAFGGCEFRDVCEGISSLECGKYVKSDKWLKKNGG